MTTYRSNEENKYISTSDRLLELIKSGKKYNVTQNTNYISEARMFLSHCKVTIEDCSYESSAALSIDNEEFGVSACQWVDTVAFGRCLAKAGFGNKEGDDGLASKEEMMPVKKKTKNSRKMDTQSKELLETLKFEENGD